MATVMTETVYGTKEEGHVMSEKVSQLAASVYSEFERMIKKYDEDVVKELMPLVVGILENLDQAYTEKQEAEVDQELLRDDNEQLLTQYEREKQLRKSSEQKYLEVEDALEEDRKVTDEKVESLESIVRMLELKTKNSSDHISRLEEKESELKKEYNKLHERYTELMRSHMDYMERAKILIGTDRIADMANSPRSRGFNLPNLKPVNMVNLMSGSGHFKSSGSPPDANSFDMMSPRSGKDSNVSIRSEMSDSVESPDINSNRGRKVTVEMKTSDKEQNTDRIDVKESGTGTAKTTVEKEKTPGSPLVKSENEPANVDSSNNIMNTADTGTHHICNTNGEKSATESDSGQSDITKDSGIGIGTQSDITKETETDSGVSVTDSRVSAVDRSENVQNLPETTVIHERTSEQSTLKIDSASHNLTNDEFFEDHLVSPVSPISPHSPQFECSYEEDYIPGALDVAIAQIVATTPEIESDMEQSGTSTASANNNTKQRISFNNTSSIFDELASQDADLIGEVDIGADITGRAVNPADYASSDSEDEQERRSTVSDNFFGMGKELENLILENTELLATKNALNIVKDDLIAKVDELSSEQEILREEINSLQAVKTKLQGRIKDLEEDLKKTRDELEKKNQAAQEQENEDEVPMAQRKRFTRVEMARVLMERNQYKERLMELQEAVRWTEMIRASREHPEINPSKKKSSIWNFFSNLFSSSPNKPSKKPLPVATVKYNAPTTNVQPVGDPNQTQRGKYNLGDKSKAYDFLQDDLMRSLGEPIVAQPNTSEKARKEREKERKEQYKQVRAHVKKDDGRMQAYGWSLPAKFQPQIPNAASTRSSVSVPVPVYCRPLLEAEQGLKIWCAAGVNLTGGKTKDGGSIVGASVFYENPPESETMKKPQHDVDRLDQEITDHQETVKNADNEQLCSFVWICTSTQTESRASVIDANNPGDILQTFRVSRSPVLCIASVPGALESDYPVDEDILNAESYPQYPEPDVTASTSSTSEDSGIGGISFVQCATGEHVRSSSDLASNPNTPSISRDGSPDRDNITTAVKDALGNQTGDTLNPTVFKAKGSPATSGRATPEPGHTPERRIMKEPSEQVKDGLSSAGTGSDLQDEEVEKMSSVLPTMWIGAQSGSLFVHSSVSQWRRCLHSVKLRDSVLNIVHVKGRVLVALADGTVAIFHRDTAGQWDLQNYHLLDLGKPHHSIRCMTVIANKHVWCGYRNKIHVVDPQSMSIQKSFDAHPRKESQVRQLAWLGDGVWVSIRLDSTLRLYHAYTHQHLQDVDIEPYVSKMLGTGKLGFSFVRITSMLISSNRLWIGTGNGVIISVPLSEANKQHVSMGASGGRPGGIVRVYADNKTESVTPGSFIPYCTMAQAQLSFHGHRDAVKFFVAVPAFTPKSPKQGKKRSGVSAASQDKDDTTESTETRLVLSGGEGYVDFRIGDGDEDVVQEVPEDDEEKKPSLSKGERSHLIVWEVSLPH